MTFSARNMTDKITMQDTRNDKLTNNKLFDSLRDFQFEGMKHQMWGERERLFLYPRLNEGYGRNPYYVGHLIVGITKKTQEIKHDLQDLINEHVELQKLTIQLAEQVGWCMNEINNIKSEK
jgi:hypothetical protein